MDTGVHTRVRWGPAELWTAGTLCPDGQTLSPPKQSFPPKLNKSFPQEQGTFKKTQGGGPPEESIPAWG